MCLPHDDRAIFNVAIRTIQVKDDQAIYGVGGGITWNSEWESEDRETLLFCINHSPHSIF